MIKRRKRHREGPDEAVERTRREARAMSRRRRIEARRALRSQAAGLDEMRVRVRGTALETKRRLRPVFGPLGTLVSTAAPRVTRALFFMLKLLAALIALVLETTQAAIRWLVPRVSVAASSTLDFLQRNVTPLRTAAAVGAGAAIALGASQFLDYHGVAVDAPGYEGSIGAIAPAPITDRETTGDAHIWILLPIAVLALVLVGGAYVGARRGRTGLAGGVAACGLIGIAVALAIDLPQGLDTGRVSLAFTGTDARLLEGFWAEISASAVLILSGGLLALYSRGVRRELRRQRRAREDARMRRISHPEIGGAGLQAGS
jgi:hypothetical protein